MEEKKQEKLTYEQLVQENEQLRKYAVSMQQKMVSMQEVIDEKRLHYLFRLLELQLQAPFSSECVDRAVKEIQQALFGITEEEDGGKDR